jgi:hypothetical protein
MISHKSLVTNNTGKHILAGREIRKVRTNRRKVSSTQRCPRFLRSGDHTHQFGKNSLKLGTFRLPGYYFKKDPFWGWHIAGLIQKPHPIGPTTS